MVGALTAAGVSVVAVTDHYRIKQSRSLMDLVLAAGIHVFPGFEAQSKDGIHLLILFDESTTEAMIERRIGECGVGDDPTIAGTQDFQELLAIVERWKAIAIAPHALMDTKGILGGNKGVARINAWKDPRLMACGIPVTAGSTEPKFRGILRNTDPQYRRERPIAIINCNDVTCAEDIAKPNATTLVKMTIPSLEGLRQAFLDPESRIRLNSDVPAPKRARIVAIGWDGGFSTVGDYISIPSSTCSSVAEEQASRRSSRASEPSQV